MAKKINNKDFFEPDFGKPLIEVFKDIQKEIDESIKGIRKFGSALKDEVKANKLETAEDVQKLSEARKKANKAIETESALQKQRVKIAQQLKEAQTEEFKQNEKLRAELNAQKKAVRDSLKEEEKLNRERKAAKGSIVQMRMELSRLTKAYDNLTKEERENAKVGGVLLKQIQRQRTEIGQLEKATGRAQRNVGNYADAWGRVGSLFSRGLGFLGITAGIAGVKSFIDSSIEAFREQEKAVAQVKAGIEATGGAAGLSLRQLKEEASALQRNTLFGDEEILKNATAQLLTFTNITGENFKRTQAAALDLATRLDGDLKSASIQLGKALNDPVANLSALSRSGIQFSTEQKEVIKTLTESGRLAEAQSIILDELNKQYGGSAEAAANADAGFTQLANSFGDVKEIVGQVIVEGLRPLIRQLKEFFDTIDEGDVRSFFNALKQGFKIIAVGVSAWVGYKAAVVATNVATKAYSVATKAAQFATTLFSGGLRGATKAFKGLNLAMKANIIGAVVSGVTTLIALFWDWGEATDEVTNSFERLKEEAEKTNATLDARFKNRLKLSKQGLESLRDDLKSEIDQRRLALDQETAIIDESIRNKERDLKFEQEAYKDIQDFINPRIAIVQQEIFNLKEKKKEITEEVEGYEDLEKQLKIVNDLLSKRNKLNKKESQQAAAKQIDLSKEVEEKQKEINAEIVKNTEDTIEKTVEAVKDGADQVADIEDDKLDKQRERNRRMLEIAQDFYREQGRARREELDREISDSKRREDQLTQLAAGGSEEAQRSLALEQQRQSELERERRKSLRRQRQLAFGLAGAELIISNARQGSSDPAGKSLEQLASFSNGVADIFRNLPAFETGGKVKGGEQIVRINEKGEEFVVKHTAVEKYGDKMLNDINNGTFDAFNYVQTPSGVVHQNFTTDFTKLESKVDTLITEIKNKPVPFIAISEVTGGLKKTIQEGNKFTTKHYRKSNLF